MMFSFLFLFSHLLSPLSKSFLPQVFWNFTMTQCGSFITHLWWALSSLFDSSDSFLSVLGNFILLLFKKYLPLWFLNSLFWNFYYLNVFLWSNSLNFLYFSLIFLLIVSSFFWENFLNFCFFLCVWSKHSCRHILLSALFVFCSGVGEKFGCMEGGV